MQLEEGLNLGMEILEQIAPYCYRMMIVGSIRRKRPEVKDIDIIIQRKTGPHGLLLDEPDSTILSLGKVKKGGTKLIEVEYKEVQVDFYLCDSDQQFEVLKLIRTGSAKHNVLLCSLAKAKGLQLKADGTGLIDPKTNKVIAWKETDILENLLGKYKEPEMRE
jgi:DNA polymerase/3'-5' exonuclease PolX